MDRLTILLTYWPTNVRTKGITAGDLKTTYMYIMVENNIKLIFAIKIILHLLRASICTWWDIQCSELCSLLRVTCDTLGCKWISIMKPSTHLCVWNEDLLITFRSAIESLIIVRTFSSNIGTSPLRYKCNFNVIVNMCLKILCYDDPVFSPDKERSSFIPKTVTIY